MIFSVKRIEEGKYKLNDGVIIYDFDYGKDSLTYKLDYDERVMTEESASAVANEFILTALDDKLKT